MKQLRHHNVCRCHSDAQYSAEGSEPLSSSASKHHLLALAPSCCVSAEVTAHVLYCVAPPILLHSTLLYYRINMPAISLLIYT